MFTSRLFRVRETLSLAVDRPREFLRSSLRLQGAYSSALDRRSITIESTASSVRERKRKTERDTASWFDRKRKIVEINYSVRRRSTHTKQRPIIAHGQCVPRSTNLNRVSLVYLLMTPFYRDISSVWFSIKRGEEEGEGNRPFRSLIATSYDNHVLLRDTFPWYGFILEPYRPLSTEIRRCEPRYPLQESSQNSETERMTWRLLELMDVETHESISWFQKIQKRKICDLRIEEW